jgi:hypothetical protein
MPDRTVSFLYKKNGLSVNANSVKLSSDEADYGIKELDSDTVVVADGTATSNPATGVYEYTFDADDTLTYLVSWEVIPEAEDTPVYKVDKVGPFVPNAGTVTASTDFKGSFKQNTTAVLLLKITDFDGNPQDATSITTTINNNAGTLVTLGVPVKADIGFYIFDWDIEETRTTGDYQAIWEYTVDGVVRSEIQDLVVSEKDPTTGDENEVYTGRARELIIALEKYILCAQSVPVYFEQSKQTVDHKTYRFTFPRWNQTAGIKVYRNQDKIVTSGVNVDYFKGEVVFSSPLTDFDVVNVDYNFRWFSDDELYEFIINAIRTLNSYPPHSGYTVNSVPDRYIPVVIKQAAVDALRRLMLCLQFQEPQQVFGGPEGANKAFDNMETLKKNYEEEVKDIYEQKKYGPYVGLTRAIVVPEFTLPGGRSRWFRYLFSSGT